MVVSVAADVCDALDLAHDKVAGAGRMGLVSGRDGMNLVPRGDAFSA
jgi:hypothetical protein